MRIHTTEKLGPKQSMTPDGFLLCQDVAIARTGEQRYYAQDGIPVEPDASGLIRILREEPEVFRPETIASFEGKPITIDHQFVTPENYQQTVVGHLQNVRRGTGADADLLLADFLIADAKAIRLVRGTFDAATEDGMPRREVSCGYDADYEQLAPGLGRQLNIVGNHVALVERGRAGARCSIKDEDTKPMKTLKERMRDFFAGAATKDADIAAAIESMDERTEAEKEADREKAETKDAITKLAATVDSLAATVAALAKPADAPVKTADAATADAATADAATADAAAVKAAVGNTLSSAEILVPGFKAPTADSITTFEDVALVQRTVLTELHKTADGAALLQPVLKGRAIDSLSEDAVGLTFDAAAELQRRANNAAGFKSPITKPTQDARDIRTVVDNMNAKAQEVWAKTL